MEKTENTYSEKYHVYNYPENEVQTKQNIEYRNHITSSHITSSHIKNYSLTSVCFHSRSILLSLYILYLNICFPNSDSKVSLKTLEKYNLATQSFAPCFIVANKA